MKKFTFTDYVFVSISDEPSIQPEEWSLEYMTEPLEMEKGEGTWDEKVCPHCHTEGKLKFLHYEEASPYDHDVEWDVNSNEYHCEACGKYICYTQRKKIYYKGGYYYLAAFPLGPEDTTKKEKTWLMPKIPGFNLNNCPSCQAQGMKHLEGDGGAAPTGASSLYGTLYCPSCGLYWYAAEYDD